ncbi:MAG: acyl-CoA dehydrogenase family protein [Candidatus Thorarchaeota archaeon]|nr:MAG: acyl-CoA dehydrogenase family protein [Candidatus Thorarchaeota archaeon]
MSDKEQKMWERSKAFTYEHITPRAHELEKRDEFPKEVVQKAYEAGLMNLHIPTEAGGPGLSLVTETLVSEATGYGCAGIATSVMCNNLAFAPLVISATTEQLKEYVEPLITGKEAKFGAFCLTERTAGSDAAAVATKAERDGDEYLINGVKCFITNAPQASLFTVFASTQPELKHKGLSVFMVPKSRAVKIGLIEKKVGQLNSVQSEVIFEDVRVPRNCLVGKEGEGFKIAMMTLDKTRAGIAAIATGVAQRAVDEAGKFASVRHQFGQPIGRFQGISFKLAEMGARTFAARWMTRYSAWLADNDLPNSKDSSMAKFFAADAAMQNAIEAVQIMGGYGYIKEYPAEKLMRDAKLLQIYEGTNEVQRVVAGNAVIKESVNLDTGFHVKYDGRDAPLM